MPTLPNLSSQAPSPWVIRYGRGLVGQVIATRAYAWTCSIIVEAGIESLERAHEFSVEWEARCAFFFFFFGPADIL
jgi:hypothetical protein